MSDRKFRIVVATVWTVFYAVVYAVLILIVGLPVWQAILVSLFLMAALYVVAGREVKAPELTMRESTWYDKPELEDDQPTTNKEKS